MKVCVVGAGYVGLVTASVLADLGHDVTCVEISLVKIEKLKRGEAPFLEKDLSKTMARGQKNRKLFFSHELAPAASAAEIIMICVGTPPDLDGRPDMTHYDDVLGDLCRCVAGPKTVVNKSTVPIGTARRASEKFRTLCPSPETIRVVSNPEFLREGTAIYDMYHGDRIVVGSDDLHAQMQMVELYSKLSSPVHICSPASAEMIKYAANSFLATKISFVNVLAELCESVGADIDEVVAGVGADKRIGGEYLRPGLGYGGSCFGKDVQSLSTFARDAGIPFGIIDAAADTNARQPARLVNKLEEVLGKLEGREVAVWGLAFKPDTDDMRDARSIDFIQGLQERGAHVRAYDPAAYTNAFALLPDTKLYMSPYDAVRGADAVCLLTEWREFAKVDLALVQAEMAHPVMLDCRNFYDHDEMVSSGWDYHCVGKPQPQKARYDSSSC